MYIKTVIKKGLYFDSLKLMGISSSISDLEGVEQGVVAMATLKNKEMLRNFGLLNGELEALSNGDLMIVVNADTAEHCQEAIETAEKMISGNIKQSQGKPSQPSSLSSTVKHVPDANLVVISVPGAYAAAEARKALQQGLHVMMFSDNVSIEDEVDLKKYAHEEGLLMMGPDCGTAIIGGVALCFANVIRSGNIGLVGASGTGGQEVTSLIHNLGGGITHYIGTGGRDLSAQVGGLMMLDALEALSEDDDSEVLVMISKPPVKEVEELVLAQAARCKKPVVVCFLNSKRSGSDGNLHFVGTLEEAALKALELAGIHTEGIRDLDPEAVSTAQQALNTEQKYVRGLFCGGTLCAEAMSIVEASAGTVNGNLCKQPECHISAGEASFGHTFLDFGEDEYTDGRPHPMIEPSQRSQRIAQEAKDPETAVILMDFVIGYGSHADPAGAALPWIAKAKENASENGRSIAFIAYVCGTDEDFQGYEEQRSKLRDAGVIVADSNAQAARLAAAIVKQS
ncbi:acyl-CoA synthetase FdrA [Lacrimispora sp.]|uniref:acyl-CoA synthetase FdrA n=1 Tax=Lacrimispora sp. TaxID=2719234 RepID=UPI002FDAB23A